MAAYNDDLKPVVDYVGMALHKDNRDTLLSLWRSAECSLQYIGSGINYSEVVLRVGLRATTFLEVRGNETRNRLESEILEIASPVVNAYDDLYLERVFIYPIAESNDEWRGGVEAPFRPERTDEEGIWRPGYLRLFMSHKSENKVPLSKIKTKLKHYGIDAFLAHEDIKDTKAWRDMIKVGLQTCHAMMTVCTPEFESSIWCNQEIGWAMSRGVLVLPVLAGSNPIGFHSDIQGPTINLTDPDEAALKLARALLEDARYRPLVFQSFVELINEASTWESLRSVGTCLKQLSNCPTDVLIKIEDAFNKHPKSVDLYAKDIPNWILAERRAIGQRTPQIAAPAPIATRRPAVPQLDDFDPFEDD